MDQRDSSEALDLSDVELLDEPDGSVGAGARAPAHPGVGSVAREPAAPGGALPAPPPLPTRRARVGAPDPDPATVDGITPLDRDELRPEPERVDVDELVRDLSSRPPPPRAAEDWEIPSVGTVGLAGVPAQVSRREPARRGPLWAFLAVALGAYAVGVLSSVLLGWGGAPLELSAGDEPGADAPPPAKPPAGDPAAGSEPPPGPDGDGAARDRAREERAPEAGSSALVSEADPARGPARGAADGARARAPRANAARASDGARWGDARADGRAARGPDRRAALPRASAAPRGDGARARGAGASAARAARSTRASAARAEEAGGAGASAARAARSTRASAARAEEAGGAGASAARAEEAGGAGASAARAEEAGGVRASAAPRDDGARAQGGSGAPTRVGQPGAEPASSAGAAAGAEAVAGAGAQAADRGAAGAAPAADLPVTPARGDVEAALAAVRPAISGCAEAGATGRVAQVRFTFASNGRVTHAMAEGVRGRTASCIARAARRARLPAFARERFVVEYPFSL